MLGLRELAGFAEPHPAHSLCPRLWRAWWDSGSNHCPRGCRLGTSEWSSNEANRYSKIQLAVGVEGKRVLLSDYLYYAAGKVIGWSS